MQFQIPQDVQIEDKIIGPITMRQLIILGVGGGMAYVIYVSLAKEYLWPVWGPPVFIIAIITLAIAFVKINEITFTRYILFAISYYMRSRKRTWQLMQGDVFQSSFVSTGQKKTRADKKADKKKTADRKKITKLDQLTEILDTHGNLKKSGEKTLPEPNLSAEEIAEETLPEANLIPEEINEENEKHEKLEEFINSQKAEKND